MIKIVYIGRFSPSPARPEPVEGPHATLKCASPTPARAELVESPRATSPHPATCLAAAVSLAAALALSACGGGAKFRPVSDVPVRIGQPYKVRGVTYTPAAQPGYDVLGYATWYGGESGNKVANGERFRPDWITAAHKTLPLPSYVEVTSLDSGRRIVVRVNDRGPFGEAARVIDLSKGAAERLGIRQKGKGAVRVRVVEPTAQDRKALQHGEPARALDPVPARTLASLQAQFARGVGPR